MKSEKSKRSGERKKESSDRLKTADKHLKAGDYTEALREVQRAIAIDPGNFYALALQERIATAREETETPTQPRVEPEPTEVEPIRTGTSEKITHKASRRVSESQVGEEEFGVREQLESPSEQEHARKRFFEEQRRLGEESAKRAEEERRQVTEELRRRALEVEMMQKKEEEERNKRESEQRRLE